MVPGKGFQVLRFLLRFTHGTSKIAKMVFPAMRGASSDGVLQGPKKGGTATQHAKPGPSNVKLISAGSVSDTYEISFTFDFRCQEAKLRKRGSQTQQMKRESGARPRLKLYSRGLSGGGGGRAAREVR